MTDAEETEMDEVLKTYAPDAYAADEVCGCEGRGCAYCHGAGGFAIDYYEKGAARPTDPLIVKIEEIPRKNVPAHKKVKDD